MSFSSRFSRLRAVACALALGACAVNPATGERQLSLMSASQEQAIGAREHPKIVAQFGGAYQDRAVQAYVERVGRRVAAVSEQPDLDFTFTVLDTDDVNAFALPGGYIYITRGLLALVNDEAELASVLGHEIAHVTARHTAERETRNTLTGAVMTGLDLLVGPGLSKIAAPGAELLLKGYSREQEHEADELGVRYLARAGYAPDALAEFLVTMDRHAELEAASIGRPKAEDPLAQYLSTHPRTGDRVERARMAADALGERGGERGREPLLAAIDGLVYGDSPAHGFVRGRVFAHPLLGFRFEVPEGFHLINGDQQVIATHPDGTVAILDSDRVRPGLPMTDYLTGAWGADLPLRSVEAIEIGGLPAATAVTRQSVRGRPVDARLVAIRFDPDSVYRFVFLAPRGLNAEMNRTLRTIAGSFRPLTPAEAQALEPLRLTVATAGPQDTVESLAARLPIDRFAEDWLRVLNDLPPDAGLGPGQAVKLVR